MKSPVFMAVSMISTCAGQPGCGRQDADLRLRGNLRPLIFLNK